jgi:hypothetical protein
MAETSSQPGWVSVANAARQLGISETAVRKRIRAGTLGARGPRGATEVLLPGANGSQPSSEPTQPAFATEAMREVVATLRSENAFLRQQLDHQTHIIAGLVQRLPELPDTSIAQDAPSTHHVAPVSDDTGRVASARPEPVWRRWWRWVTGGA